MKSKDYWQSRAEQNILSAEKNAEEIALKVERVYKESMKVIEAEINRFYARFGREQELSLAEVKKMLDPKELKAFRRQARDYYKEAYKDNWETAYTKRMRQLSAKAYMSRLEELKVNLYHEIQRVYENELNEFTDGLEKQYEESFYHTMYDYQVGIGYGASFTAPNIAAIQIAISRKWYAENYSQRIWRDRIELIAVLDEEIPRAFALGESPLQTARRIRDRLEPKFAKRTKGEQGARRQFTSKCERLARTEFNHIANEASFEAVSELNRSMGLGIEEYQILATLDNKTSEICREMDLKVFKLKDKQVGVNFAPFHANCRTTYTLVFDDEEVTERIAKDKTGKYYYVPSGMNYREWFEKYGG